VILLRYYYDIIMILLIYYYDIIMILLKQSLMLNKKFLSQYNVGRKQFFWSFFWKKNKMTHKNLKKAKKFFAQKIKRQGKHVFNTSLPIPIYNI